MYLIVAAQAAGVVSGNIGCLQQIRTYLPAHVPMLHTLELLDMAYGQEKRRPFGE